MSKFAISLLSGTILSVVAQPAFAQAAASPEEDIDSTTTGEAEVGEPGEIIVTAEKRSQRLQDVPVPVTVVNTENLAATGQLRLSDYYASVPGLDMLAGPAQGWQLNMRGVNSSNANPSVGVIIDDIPFSRSIRFGGGTVPEIDPGMLQQIEVLRGPQGTLYGASGMAGLLKLITVAPSTKGFSGSMQLGVNKIEGGSDFGYSVRGTVNIPISGEFAIRASGFNYEQPGFIDNVLTGDRDVNEIRGRGGHLAALWQPSETVNVRFSALVQTVKPQGTWNTLGSLGDLKNMDTKKSGIFDRTSEVYGLTVTAWHGPAEITSVSGYSRFSFKGSSPLTPNLVVTDDTESDKYSQEVRVRLPLTENIEWLIGGFYTREDYIGDQGLPFVDPVTGNPTGETRLDVLENHGTHRELAAFTNLTINLSKRFDVQLGGRLARYKGDFQQAWIGPLASEGGIIPDALGSPYSPPPVSYKDNVFTYLVTPRFKINRDWMAYVRVASGYRTGAPNSVLADDVLPIQKPDRTTNYEVGVKGSFLDRRVRLDLSIYQIDWEDIQLLTRFQLANGIGHDAHINGPNARSRGVEAVVDVNPWAGMTVSMWGAYNDAELTSSAPPELIFFRGVKGDQLANTSRYMGNISLRQEFDVNDRVRAYVGGELSYRGKRISGYVLPNSGLSRVHLPAFSELDLTAGVRLGTFEVGLYANNVLDKRAGVAFNPVNNNGQPNQPRTIGLTISKLFQ